MTVEIRFTRTGANSIRGSFSAGDTMRTSEEHAKHMVEEAQVAEYVTKPKAQKAADDDKTAAADHKPAAKRAHK